MVIKSWSY